jgi:[ribosomal protein S5]-alanine N-acetyltransferase
MALPIETERLLVRRMLESDYLDLHEYLSDPETYLFEPGEPIDLDAARALAKERAKGEDFLAVVLKENGKMVGHLYFKREEPLEFATWELGFIFNKAYRRRGYASEAARSRVELAFCASSEGGDGAHRVVAYCDPRNPASWRLLERIGMRKEATRRKNAFFRRDADGLPLWHDSYQYGMLAEDLG